MNLPRYLEIIPLALNARRRFPFRAVWFLIAPLAMGATLGQLWLMKAMIETTAADEAFVQPPARIVFVSNDLQEINNPEPPSPSQQAEKEEPQPEEKPAAKDEDIPPEPIEAPLPPAKEKPALVKAVPKKEEKPKDEGKTVAKKAVASSAAAMARFDSSPLYRPKPSYPFSARRGRIEGYVLLRYCIAKSGAVVDVGVIGASPPGIFESAALDAVRRWRYQPQPIDRPGMKTKITFVLRGS